MKNKFKIIIALLLVAAISTVLFIPVNAASDGTYPLYAKVNGSVQLLYTKLSSYTTWNDLITISSVSLNEQPIEVGRNIFKLENSKVVLYYNQDENGDFAGKYYMVDADTGMYVDASSIVVNRNDFTEALYNTFEFVDCLYHNFERSVVSEPMCLLEGTARYTCMNEGCGFSYTAIIPELGHKVENSSVTAEPTCTEPGVSHGICVNCGSDIESSIPTLSHNYDWLGNCKLCGHNYFLGTGGAIESVESSIKDVVSDVKTSVNDVFENSGTSATVDAAVATVGTISGVVILYYLIQLLTPFILKFIDFLTNKKEK